MTSRLIAAFVVLIGILLGIGWLGLSRMALMNANVHEISDRCWPKVQLSREALHFSTMNSRITMQIVIRDDEGEIASLLEERASNSQKISELLARIESQMDSDLERMLVAKIWARRRPYAESYQRAQELLLQKGQMAAGREMMAKVVTPRLIAYHKAWEDFVAFQSARMDAAGNHAEVSYAAARRLDMLLVTLAVVLAGAVAIFVTHGMAKEIRNRLRAEQGLREVHEALERRVDIRTAELSAANAELTAAHRGLQASEQTFRTLSNSAPIGIFLTDHTGAALYHNPHWLNIAGLSLEESLGEGWRKVIHPDDAAVLFANMKRTLHEGGNFDGEVRFSSPEGERWVHVQSAAIRSDTGEITGHVGTVENISARKKAEVELARTQKQLLETSRQAGMAEVATSVLHNVGNVLNSVNVASACVASSLQNSKAPCLTRVVALLREHETDLGAFFATDVRAGQLPDFLAKLADHLAAERTSSLDELQHLQKNIDHIKEIVAMQQTYAKVSGVMETVQLTDLVEVTLRMNTESLDRHDIRVVREFDAVSPVTVEKHKVLQILVNLVRNAKQACEAADRPDKQLTVRIFNSGKTVKISVGDNGIGISPENLARIFHHGFTTKKDGHGFGLHSGALSARELGGALHVASEGSGRGATFTLELPASTAA